jgi:predicted AAA+ superfamily ATPase
MEDKNVEVLTIDDEELYVLDEDNDCLYTSSVLDPTNVIILKKESNTDKLIKLDEIESMPYMERFINKYNNLIAK